MSRLHIIIEVPGVAPSLQDPQTIAEDLLDVYTEEALHSPDDAWTVEFVSAEWEDQ